MRIAQSRKLRSVRFCFRRELPLQRRYMRRCLIGSACDCNTLGFCFCPLRCALRIGTLLLSRQRRCESTRTSLDLCNAFKVRRRGNLVRIGLLLRLGQLASRSILRITLPRELLIKISCTFGRRRSLMMKNPLMMAATAAAATATTPARPPLINPDTHTLRARNPAKKRENFIF